MRSSRRDHATIISCASALRVDKARFLLLASALAAAACGSSDSDGGPAATAGSAGRGGNAGAVGSGGRAGSGGAAGSSAGHGGAVGSGGDGGASGSVGNAGASGAGGSSGTSGSGGSKDGGVADSSMIESGMGDATADRSVGDAVVGSDAASAEGGEAGCYDATGIAAPYCTGLAPSCAWQDAYCISTREGMNAGVGRAFVACLQNLAGCSSPNAYGCARQALNGACSDATADALCSTIEGICASVHPVSSTECHKLVDGLNWWGRYRVQNCIFPADGGTDAGAACQLGLWSCVEGI